MAEAIITQAQAKAEGLKFYFTGKPCKHGHVAKRYTSGGACEPCVVAAHAAYRAANLETLKQKHLEWREQNREYLRQKAHERYVADKARHRETMAAWAANNPQKVYEAERRRQEKLYADPARREALRQYHKRHNQQFPEKQSLRTRRRQLAKLQRIPAWLTAEDHAAMDALYAEAVRLTRETGVPHDVDHIIPLQGRMVSGLHVPSNLQILTASQNRSKGHKHAD
jgi:hypothetical protein